MNDDELKLAIALIGGLLGTITFIWNLVGYLWTYVFSHLQIDLLNERVKIANQEKLKTTTIVENKGVVAKKIDYAFLLIHPDNIDFKNSLLEVANHYQYQDSNTDTVNLLNYLFQNREKITPDIIAGNYIIINLPYFYLEQIHIGNEKIKYTSVADLVGLELNKAYNIRFVTFSLHLFSTYTRYRFTSDLFIY